MGNINQAVSGKYIILDLSACFAGTTNTISGNYAGTPGMNDMNVIKDNPYILGVILPGELKTIGDYAFRGCSSLTSVVIPGSVESIGGYAFWGCTSLVGVTIPDSVTDIGNDAFSGCPSLSFSIDGTDSSYSIRNGGEMLFKGTELISYPSANGTVTLSNVTSIGSTAFSWCANLVSVTIPSTVTSIGNGAFWYNTSLTSVTIPGSVASIRNYAFSGCNSLASVKFEGSSTNVETSNSFPGDLRAKYLDGSAGTYTTTNPGQNPTWTKQ
jgi:hypothetical protein